MDDGKSTLLWFFFLSTSFLCFNFVRSSARFPKLLFCFLLGYFSNRRRAPRTDALASVQFRPWRECRRVQLDVKFFFSLSLSLVVIIPKASFEELGALSLRRILR